MYGRDTSGKLLLINLVDLFPNLILLFLCVIQNLTTISLLTSRLAKVQQRLATSTFELMQSCLPQSN
jgi:hypothetical protein